MSRRLLQSAAAAPDGAAQPAAAAQSAEIADDEKIKQYEQIQILALGEVTQDFASAISEMKKQIGIRFNSPAESESPVYQDAKQKFLEQEEIFKKQGLSSCIANFFEKLGKHDRVQRDLLRLWNQLIDHHKQRSLFLLDEQLTQWLSVREPEYGETPITPYVVNRIILHGMLVLMQEGQQLNFYRIVSRGMLGLMREGEQLNLLSDKYTAALQKVTGWLLAQAVDHSVRRSYSTTLLSNLHVMTLLVKLPCCQDFFRKQWTDRDLFYSAGLLAQILSLENLTADQCSEIWNAVKDHLRVIIQKFDQLCSLLSLDELNEDQRNTILFAIDLAIIENGNQLCSLLSLDKLNKDQRNTILSKIDLNTSIKKFDQLCFLFNLSLDKLNKDQRDTILSEIDFAIIQKFDQLCSLFELSLDELTQAQRNTILSAIDLAIIENGNQLCSLFELSLDELTQAQRSAIWDAIRSNLREIIQNGEQLHSLFKLDFKQLTEDQHSDIVRSINQGTLRRWIKGDQSLATIVKPYLTSPSASSSSFFQPAQLSAAPAGSSVSSSENRNGPKPR